MSDVDDYIESLPAEARAVARSVREAIRKAVPKAEESISYKMPAYFLDGERLIYFAFWKRHFSLYAATKAVVAEFGKELAGDKIEKGTIQFPLAEAVPVALIGKIAKLRAKEAVGRGTQKKGR